MKSTTLFTVRHNGATVFRTLQRSHHAVIRYSSTEVDPPSETSSLETDSPLEQPSLQTTLHAELTSRPINTSTDYISPIPWNLLNISLSDFLPPSCQSRNFKPTEAEDSTDPAANPSFAKTPIPQGHHLVYFPPPVPDSSLLPDGTDSLHSPGAPFIKRLWGGGSLVFNQEERLQLVPNRLAVCGEEITDVKVKGVEGQEKVFVTVTRRIASLAAGVFRTGNASTRRRRKDALLNMDKKQLAKRYGTEGLKPWAVVEERNLVFMREKSREEAKEDLQKVGRVVKRMFESIDCLNTTWERLLTAVLQQFILPTSASLSRLTQHSYSASQLSPLMPTAYISIRNTHGRLRATDIFLFTAR